MKKILLFMTVLFFALIQGFNLDAQDIIITGIADGPLTGGLPKTLELYAVSDVADLSVYTIKNQTNANVTWSGDYALSGSVSAGDFIYIVYVGGDMANFNDFFENTLTPVENNLANLNGDDRIGIFNASDEPIDIFGEDGVDGSDTDWEYKDGWAYRNNGSVANATFAISEWTFSGVDGLEGGVTNATCTSPFPIGTYTIGGTSPSLSISNPVNNTTVYTADVDVEFTVGNFTVSDDASGDGYLTYAVDGNTAINHQNTDAIALTGFVDGDHAVVLELVDNSGVSLDPAVSATVNFTVDLNPDPVLVITSPEEDLEIYSSDVDITFTVSNFELGIDGKLAYTVDAGTTAYQTTADAISLTGLTEESHTVVLELVDMGEVSLDPVVSETVTFTVNLAGPTYTAIYDIQFAADGISPFADQIVNVKGVVSANFNGSEYGKGYYLQDGAGAWNGLYVYDELNTPTIGDSIQLTGTLVEFNSMTELKTITDYTVISTGGTVADPVVVSTFDGSSVEDYESCLVKVENAECTVAQNNYGEWIVNDGSGDLTCKDNGAFDFTEVVGNNYDIIGVVNYSYGNYTLQYRIADDIVDLGISDDPSISITSPAAGADIYDNAVEIVFTVSNFVLNTDGKVAYSIDGGDVAYQTTTDAIEFVGLTEGSHTVNLELVDMSDVSFEPAVTASLTFTVNLAGPAYTSIYDIQFAADGISPYVDQVVTVKGVVSANFNGSEYGEGYYLQDGAGAWNGLYIFDATNTPSIGDSVQVTGTLVEFYEMTELKTITDYSVIAIGGTVADPVVISTLDASSVEDYESCLVKVVNAECTVLQNGYGEWNVDDGSGALTCKDNGAFDFTEVLATNYDIIGVVNYSHENYTLQYRITSDINETTGINDNFANDVNVYPNPASEFVIIENLQNVEQIQIVNIMGQMMSQQNVEDETVTIDVSELSSGVYFVKLISGTDSHTLRIEKN